MYFSGIRAYFLDYITEDFLKTGVMKKHLQKKNLRFLLLGFGLALGIGIFDFLVQILALSRQEQLAEILRSWDPVAAFIRGGIVCVIILFTIAIMRFLQSYHETTKTRKITEEEIERRRDEIARRMLNTPPKPHKPKEKDEG